MIFTDSFGLTHNQTIIDTNTILSSGSSERIPTHTFFYNGCIFQIGDKKYLTIRAHNLGEQNSQGHYSGVKNSRLIIAELGDNLQPTKYWIPDLGIDNIEDCRAIVHDNKVYLTFSYFDSRNDVIGGGNEMFIAILGFDFNVIDIRPLTIKNSKRKWEKNFCLFFWKDEMYAIYEMQPFTIVKFNRFFQGEPCSLYQSERCLFGALRGGSPPVMIDDMWVTFPHAASSEKNEDGYDHTYTIIAYGFDPESHKPLGCSRYPIMCPNVFDRNTIWGKNNAFILAMGCLWDEDERTVLVSAGVNDKQIIIDKMYWDEITFPAMWKNFVLK